MSVHQSDNTITVRGVVVPLVWSEDGLVTAVGIAARGEKEYLVGPLEQQPDWLPRLHREVEVQGSLTGAAHGMPVLAVKRFRFVNQEGFHEAG